MVILFLGWLVNLIVAVDYVHGAVVLGLEDCREERCSPHGLGPVIRFPFRLKGSRQPSHCGYQGFDDILACTEDHHTVLDITNPSSSATSNKLFIQNINYTSQEIVLYDPNGCLPVLLFNLSLSSTPFKSLTLYNYTLLSCPPSVERDHDISRPSSPTYQYYSSCMAKLSPCLGDPAGNQIFAIKYYCSIDNMPLVSCTKLDDYTSIPYSIRNTTTFHWSVPSCEYCQKMKKNCRRKFEYQFQDTEIECTGAYHLQYYTFNLLCEHFGVVCCVSFTVQPSHVIQTNSWVRREG